MAAIREEVKKQEKQQKQVEEQEKQRQPETIRLKDRLRRHTYVVTQC